MPGLGMGARKIVGNSRPEHAIFAQSLRRRRLPRLLILFNSAFIVPALVKNPSKVEKREQVTKDRPLSREAALQPQDSDPAPLEIDVITIEASPVFGQSLPSWSSL